MSDLIGSMDMAVFTSIATVLIVLVFAAVVSKALMTRRSKMDRYASIPLHDDVVTSGERSGTKGEG